MGNIYKSATKVLVWLGSPVQETSPAFDFLRTTELDSAVRTKYPEENSEVESLERLGLEALQQLCSREYWGRLWVIQELVLVQNVKIYYKPENYF
jgi:hypothetical protein